MAGVFNIIAGALNLAWALLMVVYIVLVAAGAMDEEFTSPDDPPKAFMIVMLVVMFLMSAAAGALQVAGGIALLKRARNARTLGFAAAIAGFASLLNCCIWPLYIGSGIYTIVILQKPEVAELLREPPRY